jgi:type III restriction enzyme
LCKQVVGRGLRHTGYDVNEDGKLSEEAAKVFGVSFEVIPFKENPGTARPPALKRHHVRAISEKAQYAMTVPHLEEYRQPMRHYQRRWAVWVLALCHCRQARSGTAGY